MRRRRAIIVVLVVLPFGARCSCGTDGGDAFDAAEDVNDASDVSTDTPQLIDAGDAADADAGDPCTTAKQNHDVLGCNYVLFNTPSGEAYPTWTFGCTALLIANPNNAGAKVSLVYKGSGPSLSNALRIVTAQGRPFTYAPAVNDTIPPNGTAVLAVTQGASATNDTHQGVTADCPFPAAFGTLNVTVPVDGTTTGIELQSSLPVFATYVDAFDLDPETVEQSLTASTLRSIESWDVRYREVGLNAPGRPSSITYCPDENTYPTYPQFFAVAARSLGQDLLPQIDASAASFSTYLDEVRAVNADDLSIGRAITSTTPVGLSTSSREWYTQYEGGAGFGNFVLHSVAPPSAWGHEYAAAPYPARYSNLADPPRWRVIGDVEGTVLSYSGAIPTGAPSTLGPGELAVFSSSAPFVVASQDAQHPFYLDEIMPSCDAVISCSDQLQGENCRGAPTVLSVQPQEEFSTHSVLLTNPNLPDVWLVVVRKANNGSFADVTLDCAGTLSGWTAIDASDYQFTYVALSRGNFEPQTYGGGTCMLGPHALDSALPFSVSVWGWGTSAAAETDDAGDIFEGPQRSAYAFSVIGQGVHVFPQRPPSTN